MLGLGSMEAVGCACGGAAGVLPPVAVSRCHPAARQTLARRPSLREQAWKSCRRLPCRPGVKTAVALNLAEARQHPQHPIGLRRSLGCQCGRAARYPRCAKAIARNICGLLNAPCCTAVSHCTCNHASQHTAPKLGTCACRSKCLRAHMLRSARQPSRALFTRPLLVLDTVQRALLFALAVGVVRSSLPLAAVLHRLSVWEPLCAI